MFRRDLLKTWMLLSAGGALAGCANASGGSSVASSLATLEPLPAPGPQDRIPVAFLLSEGAEVVDFAGPWGVFEYVILPDRDTLPFELFTVAETSAPLIVSGGMKVVANYTYENAPQPKVIVIPAQSDPTPAAIAWLQRAAAGADLTMSVCTGAFLLAESGLLNGRDATTHHGSLAVFAADYQQVRVHRGARFTDSGNVATAGGLTSGIDLALHVVERYFGQDVAEQTILSLEYQGQGWRDPASNAAYAQRPRLTGEPPVCPVCEYVIPDRIDRPTLAYRGKTYTFCGTGCRDRFERDPEYFAEL